jgi:hypothetical protein
MKNNSKMSSLKKSLVLAAITFGLTAGSAQTDSKSTELVDALNAVNGGYTKLAAKKDVQFTYIYDNMGAGKDVSTERHIFNGEHSWGSYTEHKRNVFPDKEGLAVQSLVHGKPALSLDGVEVTDEKAIGGTVFLRKVNFYWFTMMYKLKDPGTNYKHLGTEDINGVLYDKVSLMYSADVTKKEKNDEYILYFNPETHLIDQFYFSLPDWGINDPILKMTLAYEMIDGLLISTIRKSYGPDENGTYQQNGVYTFKDIKFDNGFTPEGFVQEF